MKKILWVALLVAAACGDDDSSSSGGGGTPSRGTTPKGSPCKASIECAEQNARCLVQGSASACTGALVDGSFEQECDGATSEAAAACPGLVCVSLKANGQNKKGICSTFCSDASDCGPNSRCFSFSSGKVCLSQCAADADCGGGFVCVPDPGGSVCLVRTM